MPKASGNTSSSKSPLESALAKLPAPFRSKIVQPFLDSKKKLGEGNFEGVGLASGKFCESVLRLLQHETTGASIPFGQKIPDFSIECRKIIDSPKGSASESLRIVMPRALVFVYTVRNKRGIGHVGGDVDANRIDAVTIARACDWVVCELIRVYHNLSLEEAQDIVDNLSERHLPDVWSVGGKKRILRAGLPFKDQVLLLCYSDQSSSVFVADLFEWVEYSNASVFRRDVIRPLHKARLIEYDSESELVTLSPKGVHEVEERILTR